MEPRASTVLGLHALCLAGNARPECKRKTVMEQAAYPQAYQCNEERGGGPDVAQYQSSVGVFVTLRLISRDRE